MRYHHYHNHGRRSSQHDVDLDEEAALGHEASYLSGEKDAGRTADQAGAILGIANIFVVLPQFVTSFISSIVFAFIAPAASSDSTASPGSGIPDPPPFGDVDRRLMSRAGMHVGAASDDAIGFVFRVGGVSALVAAWFCWQMRRRKREGQM